MSRLTSRRGLLAAITLALLAAVVVPALAATPRNTTVSVVETGTKFKINRFAADTVHFRKDAYEIKSGGTLTIRNRTGEPHTLSVVRRSSLPRTSRQINNCFEGGICAAFGAAHQFPPGEGPPAKPLVDPDGKGLDQVGDSVFFNPKQSVKIKVSARPGRTLRFICIIHPWMQSKLRVRK